MDLESVKIKIILDGKEAQVGLRRFNKLVGNIGKDTKVADKSFKNLGKTLKRAGLVGEALGIGAVALTMKSFAENAHKAAEEVYKLSFLSQRTGISVQNLTKTGTALESLGIKATTYQQAVDSLSSGVARLSLGDDKTVSALASMGIFPIVNGKQMTGEEIFSEVANYAKRMATSGEVNKNAARQQLMSLNFAPELIEQMWGGADEFFRIIEEQSKKVGSLSEKEIEKAERYKKMYDELSTAIGTTSQKLFYLSSGPIVDFGNALRKVVKASGDIITAAGENELTDSMASGVMNYIYGTKLMPIINTGYHKIFSPLMEKKSLLGGLARKGGAFVEGTTNLASKAFGYANIYMGSEKVMEGMVDFWKGNDAVSKWVYENISSPIGEGILSLIEGGEKQPLQNIKNQNMQLFPNLPLTEFPIIKTPWENNIQGGNDIRVDIKQEFNGNVEAENVKDATTQALDVSFNKVNLM